MPDSREGLEQFLRENALFSALADEDLPQIADVLVPVEMPAGELLFEEGEDVDGLFLVEKGKLTGLAQEGSSQSSYQRWDVIGLTSNNYSQQRQETVKAVSASRVWFFSAADIHQLSLERPAFRDTLLVLANSQEMVRTMSMPWLEPGEKISLIARKHPIFLLFTIIPPLSVFGLGLLALYFWFSTSSMTAMIGMLVLFFFCALWMVWNINNWANDFYLITSKRMVWVEKISGFYDSRQEAPLGTLISVGIRTSQLGAIFGFSDVLVRTFIGDIRFERVAHAKTIGKLIENYWAKSKHIDLELDAKEIRKALRAKFGKAPEDVSAKELEEEFGISNELPGAELSFFEWLFSDFLKVRYESGGAITYRKHWFILLKKEILALLGLILSSALMIGVITRNITGINYSMALTLGIFLLLVCGAVMLYQYVDWRNDIFQLTPNQVVDLDRKPFGRESRRAAPLQNILSIEYERRGIIPMLFNFGTVYITVGNTQLTFNNVYQPSIVQQDIFTRMGKHAQEKETHQIDQERERMAQWFKVFQEEYSAAISSEDVTSPLNPPSI